MVAAAAEMVQPGQSLAVAGLLQPSELVHALMQEWNDELREHLRHQQAQQRWPAASTRTDRLRYAMQWRLECVEPYVRSQTWASAMALGARPDLAPTTQGLLQDMIRIMAVETKVDAFDRDLTEFECLSLGAVYVVVELHLLADTSRDSADTWDFLRQRLEDWQGMVQTAHTESLAATIQAWLPSNGSSAAGTKSASDSFSDAAYVTSTIASALASGAASLVLGHQVGSSFLPKPSVSTVDGTDPRHYASPSSAAASKAPPQDDPQASK